MLFILFELDQDRYAVDASRVIAVLPLMRLKLIPRATVGVAGVFTYHGTPVPVLDLSALALGRPAQPRLSTRVLLVSYPDSTGRSRSLGLIAENATGTLRRDAADFVDSGFKDDGTPYLGPVATGAGGLIQWIGIDQLLPVDVRNKLFQAAEEVGTS